MLLDTKDLENSVSSSSEYNEHAAHSEGSHLPNQIKLDEDIAEPQNVNVTPLENKETPLKVSRLYTGIDKGVFKTADRLMDDVKADLLFLLGGTHVDEELSHGILKLPGIKYSSHIESVRYNPYDLYFLDRDGPEFGLVERRSSFSNPNDKITIIRAILYNNSQSVLSQVKVYHVKILIKTKDAAKYQSSTKNEFHLIDELNDADKIDLMADKLHLETDSDVSQSALPKVIDESTYVCSVTNKIIRIVISEPEFNQEDLNDFEIGPINVRYNKALTEYPGLKKDIPSPAECLYTLYKAIKGPLLLSPGEEQRTIPAANKSLNSNINPNILLKRLQFELSDDEFIPPLISDITIRDQDLIRESYIRKRLEIILLGTKAHSGAHQNPFNSFHFTTSLEIVFTELGDLGSVQAHKYTREPWYINLSVYPFYSAEMIILCYQKTVNADRENQPTYFDNLRKIYALRPTRQLDLYIKNLLQANVFGQKDIDDAYTTLGIDAKQSKLMDDDLLLTMYKTEIAANPMNGSLRTAIKTLGSYRNSSKIAKYLKYEPLPLDQAYSQLDIDATVDDDVVNTAVMIKRTDSPNDQALINRALITIATERRSPELLYSIEQEFPDLYDPISFKDACEYLGVDESASESQIITIYQAGNREIKSARNALKVIGQVKNSKVIDAFLKTGIIDHNLLPAENWPVGLNNIGNTCYLNSLLQYYFSIKPLRDAILNFHDIYSGQEIYQNRRIGGRLVQDGEIERSFQFVYQLRDLFHEQIHSNRRCVTPSKELAYLAFLPSVAEVEFQKTPTQTIVDSDVEVIEAEVSSEHVNNNVEDDRLIEISDDDDDANNSKDIVMVDSEHSLNLDTSPLKRPIDHDVLTDFDVSDRPSKLGVTNSSSSSIVEVQNDGELTAAPEPEVTSKPLKIQETEMETAYEIGRQQDVTECIGNVLSQIEAAFKPDGFDENDKEQNDLVKRLFFGKTVQHLIDVNDPSIRRDKTDRFSNLFVNIADKPRNLYEAFDFVFKNEEVTIDSGVFNRSERITELPIVLQIQISRVYFDRVKLRPYKNIDPLPFPETIYMDRYLDTDDPEIIAKRAEVDSWKAEIIQLKERRERLLTKDDHEITFRDSLKATKEWLESESIASPETITVLEKQIKKIDDELMSIYHRVNELEVNIDNQFTKFQKHGYSIFAIFIHRGEANYGHYWIYIKDKKSQMYRKYNDEIVSEVTLQEVFNFEVTNTATPYFLGYIKQGHEDEVEPLLRVINQ